MSTRVLLCVEPDGAAAAEISGALEPYGFQVEVIADGERAIEWGKNNPPALIIVSVEPRKVGYAICNKLKRSPTLREVPLMLTSAEETPEAFEQHKRLKTHADQYLFKPLDVGDLLAKVDALVGLGDLQAATPAEEIPITADDEIAIAEDMVVEESTRGSADNTAVMAVEEEAAQVGEDAPGLEAAFDRDAQAAFAEMEAGGEAIEAPAPAAEEFGDDGATRMSDPWMGVEAGEPPAVAEAAVEGAADVAPEPTLDIPVPDESALAASEAEPPALVLPEAEAEPEAPPAPPVRARAATPPPAPMPSLAGAPDHTPPPLAYDEGLVTDLQSRIRSLETERDRLKKDAEEARARTSQQQPFSKEKEFLNLREIINKKEKDILDLRDSLDAKERQILDHKDKIRELERARRDLEERSLGFEKNLVAANEKVAALAQDKERAVEREKGLKGRLDDALGEIRKAHDEVDSLKKKLTSIEDRMRGETERVRSELEARIAEMDDLHRQEGAHLSDEHAAAMKSAEADHLGEMARADAAHKAEVDSIQRRASDELTGTTDRLQTEMARLKRDHEKALQALREEQVVQLAAERQAHDTALEDKERSHRDESLGMRRRHEEELAAAEERRTRELADAEARRMAELDAAEVRRRGDLQARDDEHHNQLADLERRHLEEKTEQGERHRGELDQSNGRASRAEGSLAARIKELEEATARIASLEADLDHAGTEIAERDVKLGQNRDRIGELEARVADLEDQVLRAFQRITRDEKASEKARKALAVALAMLEGGGGPAAAAAGGKVAGEDAPT